MTNEMNNGEPSLEDLRQLHSNLTNAMKLENNPEMRAELQETIQDTRRQMAELGGHAEAHPMFDHLQEPATPTDLGAPPPDSFQGNTEPPPNVAHYGGANPLGPIGQAATTSRPVWPTPAPNQAGVPTPAITPPASTGGKLLTSRSIIALAAILAAVAITWIVVAKPGSNSTSAADGAESIQQAPSGPGTVDSETAVDDRVALYQRELSRILATTPIIFQPSQVEISEQHKRTLDIAYEVMARYPGLNVSVLGFTDPVGDVEANQQLSLRRAENVKDYLVSKGLAAETLTVEARGEEASSGAADLANLERKVEFEVQATTTNSAAVQIAIIAPSAADDLAFTQSMVDAVNVISAERGNVEVAVEPGLFEPEEAGDVIEGYAARDFDLVIAHGTQFGAQVQEIAGNYPNVAFAWGTAADNFGLSNVYSYSAAAEQGGYVLGAISAATSERKSLGVIGPIEVGDAERYVNGFRAGAIAEQPGVNIQVEYINSFSDLDLAAESATRQLNAGADVLTGTGQMVTGAIPVVTANSGLWVGTQSSQAPLAPNNVVASQVYHWETILRQILADADSGSLAGREFVAELSNGGLVIEFNPEHSLDANVRQRGEQIVEGIKNGSISVPGGS